MIADRQSNETIVQRNRKQETDNKDSKEEMEGVKNVHKFVQKCWQGRQAQNGGLACRMTQEDVKDM